MFKTLIVDDDFLVRSYLKTLNAWERTGYEIVQDVRDGEEALKVMEETEIDLVITDISMPLMDGIQLIQEIKKQFPDPYIIVLSCHDDFDYVKEAMRLGANEYVLKNTLDEDTLYRLLVESTIHIESKKEESQGKELKKKLIKMGSHAIKYHFFNEILSGKLTGEERERRRNEAGIHGEFHNSAVINMFMLNWNELGSNWLPLEAEQYSQSFLSTLVQNMERLLHKDSEDIEIIYLGAGIFCCFLDLSSMRRSSIMRQRLTSVASVCFRCCQQEPYEFGVGVSNICVGEKGMIQAYQQAREMLKLSFYSENDVLYYDCRIQVATEMPYSAEELCEQIGQIKAGRKREELSKAFHKILLDCKKNHVEGREIIKWMKRLDEKAGIFHTVEYYNRICSMKQLEEALKQYEEELFAGKKVELPDGISNVVRLAVEFIHEQYQKQISLQDVADASGVNAAYLSYLFKQEMGIGFSNYLLNCRMECAKSLLSSTNLKIKEVAAEAGFHDYHYFSKAFKKLNECSPVDYRKRF